MPQIAVFVDAGYLYAQGAVLLKGRTLGRESIRLSETEVLDQLAKTASAVAPDCRLLRIYWYDGVLRGNRPSIEQDLIGQSPNTKLRLGLVNSRGRQKGVDSLIVTDLIDLARNHAIADALILSGDEDIKIGVQVAQTFGVRVHLLGIKPARGSQSDNLMMEADTCHEWDETVVGSWMHCDDVATAAPARSPAATSDVGNGSAGGQPLTANGPPSAPDEFQAAVTAEVANMIGALSVTDLERHAQFLDANPGRVHSDIDRPMLASLRNRLNRDLSDTERKEYRQAFAAALRNADASAQSRQ